MLDRLHALPPYTQLHGELLLSHVCRAAWVPAVPAMTWVKISDTALDEPFLLDIPRGATLLHLEALAYSNRYATDGVIRREALRKLTEPDPEAAVAALVTAELWIPFKEGWKLVWLLSDQPTADEIRVSQEQARMRQKRLRHHTKGDHSLRDPTRCKVLLARDKVRDVQRDETPPPSRPSPTVRERERGVRAATSSATLRDRSSRSRTMRRASLEPSRSCATRMPSNLH